MGTSLLENNQVFSAQRSPYNSIKDRVSEVDDDQKNLMSIAQKKNDPGGGYSSSSSSDAISSHYDEESDNKSSLSNDLKKVSLTPRSTPNVKGQQNFKHLLDDPAILSINSQPLSNESISDKSNEEES